MRDREHAESAGPFAETFLPIEYTDRPTDPAAFAGWVDGAVEAITAAVTRAGVVVDLHLPARPDDRDRLGDTPNAVPIGRLVIHTSDATWRDRYSEAMVIVVHDQRDSGSTLYLIDANR